MLAQFINDAAFVFSFKLLGENTSVLFWIGHRVWLGLIGKAGALAYVIFEGSSSPEERNISGNDSEL